MLTRLRRRLFISANELMSVVRVISVVLTVRFNTLTTPTMALIIAAYGLITVVRVVSVASVN